MKQSMKIHKIIFVFLLPLIIFLSCERYEPGEKSRTDPDPLSIPMDSVKRTLLVYAVASNDLYSDWIDDCQEIMQGAQRISGIGKDVNIVLYSVVPDSATATLSVIRPTRESCIIEEIKTYDRSIFSTDPERISQVIDDVRKLVPAISYGAFFWSHASGWVPFFSKRDDLKKRAFGLDYDPDRNADRCDIIELADAIPAGVFDFLWFDACYMGSIEVAYEMSRKVPSMVAYPSEVAAEGLPYDLILPYLAQEKPDLGGAALKMTEYFEKKRLPYSIGVYNFSSPEMTKIKSLFYAINDDNPIPPETWKVMTYSRSPYGPYFDINSLVMKMVETSDSDMSEVLSNFHEALEGMVTYKACSDTSFGGKFWDKEQCSGISVWLPSQSTELQKSYLSKMVWGSN